MQENPETPKKTQENLSQQPVESPETKNKPIEAQESSRNPTKDNEISKNPLKDHEISKTHLKSPKKTAKVLEFETMKLPKIYTPYTYIMYSNKLAEAKMKFKETMKEIGVELEENQEKWPETLKKGQEILKKSVSVKYLGVKDGQIGILSKRVPISEEKKNEKGKKNYERSLEIGEKKDFLVNKYSLPHPLHSIIKREGKKQRENVLFGDFAIKQPINRRKSVENRKEIEIKKKIQKMIEKKKEIIQEKSQIKLKSSLADWNSFLNSNVQKQHPNGFSYSSKIKSLGFEQDHEKTKGEVKKLIHNVFYR